MLKEFVRPPFANYDIVVYFGCGLFSLPFINHYYVNPLGIHFPKFNFGIGMPFVDTFISTLSLVFSVYIIGHIIAYVSSQMVEKAVDTAWGKTSSAVLVTSHTTPQNRNRKIRQLIRKQLGSAFSRYTWFSAAFRLFFHLPLVPLYFLIYKIGIFGYYCSRIPPQVLKIVRQKLGYININIGGRRAWFKPLEHDVINNNINASGRMYNYLLISGIFRSISLLFIISIWIEIIDLIHFYFCKNWIFSPFMADKSYLSYRLTSILIFFIVYIFCLFSYMKFQRRYVEEAIFAFVFAKTSELTSAPAPLASSS